MSSPAASNAPWSEYAVNMANCMQQKGWNAIANPDNSYSQDEIPEGQYELLAEDEQECLVRFGYDEPPEYTDETLADLYDKELETRACLEGFGFVDPAPPPSLEVYIDTFRTESTWSAYRLVVEGSVGTPDNWYELNAACPQPTP